MQQLNQIKDWETEMDRLERMHRDVFRLRQEMREHELYASLRCLITVGVVLAAWYFRAV